MYKTLYAYRTYLLFVVGVLSLVDIFFVEKVYAIVTFVLLGFWFATMRFFEMKERAVTIFGLGFLVVAAVFLMFGINAVAEKFAIWADVMLVVAVIMRIKQLWNGC